MRSTLGIEYLYNLSFWTPPSFKDKNIKPGEYLLRLPQNLRESLQTLKSSDLDWRLDTVFPLSHQELIDFRQKKEMHDLLVKFDREFLKIY